MTDGAREVAALVDEHARKWLDANIAGEDDDTELFDIDGNEWRFTDRETFDHSVTVGVLRRYIASMNADRDALAAQKQHAEAAIARVRACDSLNKYGEWNQNGIFLLKADVLNALQAGGA